MKPFLLSPLAAVLLAGGLGSGVTARADDAAPAGGSVQSSPMNTIAAYADELSSQGVTGPRFVQMVDQRYWKLNPSANEHPGNRGVGALVQELQARGLRGEALAKAIEEEQRKRATRIDQPPLAPSADTQPEDFNDD